MESKLTSDAVIRDHASMTNACGFQCVGQFASLSFAERHDRFRSFTFASSAKIVAAVRAFSVTVQVDIRKAFA